AHPESRPKYHLFARAICLHDAPPLELLIGLWECTTTAPRMMAESPGILHPLFGERQTACVRVGRISYSSIVAPIPLDSPGQLQRMTRPSQCNSTGTRVIVTGRNTFMVTDVSRGGRMGIRMNNPFPLMFPVFPSTWRERPRRLFQRTSTGNSTGMRIPARLLLMGSPPKRARLACIAYLVSAIVARRNS